VGGLTCLACFVHSPAAEPIARVTFCANLKPAGNTRGDPDDVEAQSTASLHRRLAGAPSSSGPDRRQVGHHALTPQPGPRARGAGTCESAGLTQF